jgi:hypothetical protein
VVAAVQQGLKLVHVQLAEHLVSLVAHLFNEIRRKYRAFVT